MKEFTLSRAIKILVAVAALTPITAAQAQTLLPGSHSIDGNLCVGSACTGTENYPGQSPLNVKDNNVGIYFEDTSDASGSFPFADWEIKINDTTNGGENYFAIRDVSRNANVLHIENNAPDNSLYVDTNGEVGLGTSLPQANLHIVDSGAPSIRFTRTSSGGATSSDWVGFADTNGFRIFDETSFTTPFHIQNGAPTSSLWVDTSGSIGMGTNNPTSALHLRRSNGTAAIAVENLFPSPSAVREMFAMRNNGGSYFTLENTQSGTAWFFTHEDAAPNRFIIADNVPDGPEMTVNADGDITIQGNFFANGGSQLNVPDYVFSDDYALRPLAEVASFIEANRHLPEVPSADQIADEGLNMTAMQMTLLKKVEELTLYTIALEAENAEMRVQLAGTLDGMASLQADVNALKVQARP